MVELTKAEFHQALRRCWLPSIMGSPFSIESSLPGLGHEVSVTLIESKLESCRPI